MNVSPRFIAVGLFCALLASCGSGGGGGSASGGSTPTHSIGVTVTGLANVTGLVLQDNGADNLTVSSSGSYSFKTQLSGGSSYAVTILSQPAGHTCIVHSGSGTVAGATITVVVVCPWLVGYAPSTPPENEGVFAYYIDQTSGSATPVSGSPFAAGNNTTAIAISPTAGYLYAANQADGTISAFSVDPASGVLSPIAGSPFAAGSAPVAIAIDVHGKFLFAANSGSSTVSAFTIDASNGTLTAVAGSPFATESTPTSVAVDSTGSYLYVADITPNNATTFTNPAAPMVSAYSVDDATGALTPVAGSPFVVNLPVNYWASAFAVDPVNSLLYVGFTNGAPFFGGMVGVESIDTSTGAIAPVAGGPFSTGGGPGVGSFAIDTVGQILYVADPDAGEILGLFIDATGTLTAIPDTDPGNLGVSADPEVASVDPSGHFLYANSTCTFAINGTTGVLTTSSNATCWGSGAPVVFSTPP
jgi:6-phosphogluconolactonase (cycloisomerase 2 family)